MIATLFGVIGDPVRPFPSWANFPLGWIFGCRSDFVYDKVPYVKSSELHSFVIVFGHLLLILRHPARSSFSNFVQAIQIDLQLIIVVVFMEELLSNVGDSHFNQDYCLNTIGESKGVSLVGVLAVVMYAHRTLGNSSDQAPFASSNQALMILISVQFVTFVCLFAFGCLGDENWFLMPKLEQKSLKPCSSLPSICLLVGVLGMRIGS